METREELKKKIALCDKLGASKFQTTISKLEKLKFEIFKKLFSSNPKNYERCCQKKRDRDLKKAKTKEETKKIWLDYIKNIEEYHKYKKKPLTREELKEKIALCDKLGASKFQPYVLKMEKLKFKVLKDIFPFLQNRYEKYLTKNRDKALKKAKTEEERKKILAQYRHLIIEWRKEIKREKNRNYHMDENKPTEMIEYLNWNKSVHKKGLIKDGVLVTGTIVALALGISPMLAVPALATEVMSAFINFQCVNIQNSHIYRYKLIEEHLKKREARREQAIVENYGEATNAYSRSIAESKELPSLMELVDNVKTAEEAVQLRQMILANLKASGIEVPNVSEEKTEQYVQSTIESQPKHQVSQAERQVDLEIEKMVNEGKNSVEQPVQKTIGGK